MWAACIMLRKQGQPLVIPAGLDFNKALQASCKRNGSNLEIPIKITNVLTFSPRNPTFESLPCNYSCIQKKKCVKYLHYLE